MLKDNEKLRRGVLYVVVYEDIEGGVVEVFQELCAIIVVSTIRWNEVDTSALLFIRASRTSSVVGELNVRSGRRTSSVLHPHCDERAT